MWLCMMTVSVYDECIVIMNNQCINGVKYAIYFRFVFLMYCSVPPHGKACSAGVHYGAFSWLGK